MIYVIALLLLGFLCKSIYSDGMNPGSFMSFLWSFVLFIYGLHLIPLDQISRITYYVIVYGVLFFSFGCICCKPLLKPTAANGIINAPHSNQPTSFSFEINYKVLIAFQIISILMFLPEVLNTRKLFSEGYEFSYLRSNQMSVVSNALITLPRNYIFRPFVVYLVYPITMLCLLSNEKFTQKKYLVIFLSLLVVYVNIMSMGGRAPLVYSIMFYVVISKLLNQKILKNKYLIFGASLFIIADIIFFTVISSSRGIEDLRESNVMYIAGCVALLDYYLKGILPYTHGGAFFYGFSLFIFTMLENIGIDSPDSFLFVSQEIYVEDIKCVGVDLYMNAFVSWFFYLFKDGGFFALAIESFIYGLISGLAYISYRNNTNDPRKIVFYSIIVFTIVFSFIRFQFTQHYLILALLYIPLFFKKRTKS